MSLQDLLKDAQKTETGGAKGLAALVSTSTPIRKEETQALKAQQQDQAISKRENSFGGLLKNTIKGIGSTFYDIAGSLVLPTATGEELRSPQFLKDTIKAIPGSINDVASNLVTHPVNSAQSIVGGAARGISNEITDILTNLFVSPEERPLVREEVQNTLDKYLGATPQNNISQGFELAGRAAPSLAAGMVGGELAGGGKLTRLAGSGAGFTAVGQAEIPREASLKERVDRATQDLSAMGLFELGGAGAAKARSLLTKGFQKAATPVIEPIGINKLVSEAQTPIRQNIPKNIPQNEGGLLETVSPKSLDGGTSSVSKLASSVEAKAVANGLAKDLGDLPEFARTNWEYQGQRATEIMTKDYGQAKRIALGEEPPPSDVLPEALFKAVEDKATADRDVTTLKQLATQSALLGESRAMGQRIGYLSQRNPESPVAAIADVVKARQESLKIKDIPKAKRSAVKEIKDSIRKNAPKQQTIAEFIDNLRC